MQILNDTYKKNFSNQLYREEKWELAKQMLEKEHFKFPGEYYLITELSLVCYNLKEFGISLNYAQKAIAIESNDVLVIYNYGCALSGCNKEKEAIKQWDKILNKDIHEIAYGDYGEGLKYAKSIINNTRYRKALSLIEMGHLDEALLLINEHLKNRQSGIESDFSKKQVLKKQKLLNPQFVVVY